MVGKKMRESLFWFGQHLFKIDFVSDWFCQLEKLNKSGYNLKLVLLQIQCLTCINLALCSA